MDIKVPHLGEVANHGIVGAILTPAGTRVRTGEGILELESDKATMEIPSPCDGLIVSIHVSIGDDVTEGQLVCQIQEDGKANVATDLKGSSDSPPSSIVSGEPITGSSGTAESTAHSLHVNDHLAVKEEEFPSVPTSPSVRRMARQLGVDIGEIRGSGWKGRILKSDVEHYVKDRIRSSAPGIPDVRNVIPGGGSLVLPDLSLWGEVDESPLPGIRRHIAENVTLSATLVPQVTQFDNADVTMLEQWRKEKMPGVTDPSFTISLNAILIKILALALYQFPRFNSSIDLRNNRIVHRKYYHVGIAVDTSTGLMVPVLREVDRMGLAVVQENLKKMVEKARSGHLSADEMKGGCITLTSLGPLGTTHFTPLLNYPESAILGVGKIAVTPVYVKGNLEPRHILPLSLTYDHRLIDGSDAARFVRWIAVALENPLATYI